MSNPSNVWVFPSDGFSAPLPAIQVGNQLHLYQPSRKIFAHSTVTADAYLTFEECRQAMLEQKCQQLEAANQLCRDLAGQIEHLKSIQATNFPEAELELPPSESAAQPSRQLKLKKPPTRNQ
jgi:hypothetical protein